MIGWMLRSSVAFLFAVLVTCTARAQANEEVIERAGAAALEEIYNALRSGSVESMMSVTADRIDLTVFGSSELLSRSQAKYVVKDFFRTYPPRRLDVHQTSPSDGNWFASASYWYDGADAPLTVYLRMRAKDVDRWELREIRFGRPSVR